MSCRTNGFQGEIPPATHLAERQLGGGENKSCDDGGSFPMKQEEAGKSIKLLVTYFYMYIHIVCVSVCIYIYVYKNYIELILSA